MVDVKTVHASDNPNPDQVERHRQAKRDQMARGAGDAAQRDPNAPTAPGQQQRNPAGAIAGGAGSLPFDPHGAFRPGAPASVKPGGFYDPGKF